MAPLLVLLGLAASALRSTKLWLLFSTPNLKWTAHLKSPESCHEPQFFLYWYNCRARVRKARSCTCYMSAGSRKRAAEAVAKCKEAVVRAVHTHSVMTSCASWLGGLQALLTGQSCWRATEARKPPRPSAPASAPCRTSRSWSWTWAITALARGLSFRGAGAHGDRV